MNKSQVIGGVVCLIIAAGLAAVSFALPPEKVWFSVGENNIPLVPIIVGALGLLLLVTARRKEA